MNFLSDPVLESSLPLCRHDGAISLPEGFSMLPEDSACRVAFSIPECDAIFLPGFDGQFERHERMPVRAWFRAAGALASEPEPSDVRLALPFLVLSRDGQLQLFGLDPEFSAGFTVSRGFLEFSWKWLAAAGSHAGEQRRFFCESVGSVEEAIACWHSRAMPGISPSPRWLQEIAFQDYDYFSGNGEGWFRDIEAACCLIAPEDRGRAMFTLHGWYDRIGRYCFDAQAGRLDDAWTVFPHMQHPDLQKLDAGAMTFRGALTSLGVSAYQWRNLKDYHPVPLSWEGVRGRLDFARARGFRTCFYLMTGMQAEGPKEKFLADGTALDVATQLWQGPDMLGETYLRNPLHAGVVAEVLNYVRALLDKIGDLCDAFVIDESYYIPAGALGPAACPGYADRAQLRLFQKITELCHAHTSPVAVLSADQVGLPYQPIDHNIFPYCLACDGIYQDSGTWPDVFGATRFATWTKAALICNWAPQTNLLLQERAIRQHNTSLAWSRGAWGDDLGLGDLDEKTFAQVRRLWEMRRQRHMPRTAPVREIRPHVASIDLAPPCTVRSPSAESVCRLLS